MWVKEVKEKFEPCKYYIKDKKRLCKCEARFDGYCIKHYQKMKENKK